MTEFRNIRQDLAKLTESEFIVKYNLVEKATQVLLKLIAASEKAPDKFLTLAELRRNFKSITTDEVYAITGEFEKLNLVETTVQRTKLVVRFNILGLETNNFDLVRQEKLRNYIKDKENKRVEHARKVLKEFEQRQTKDRSQLGQTLCETLPKTARELHIDKECDPNTCKFCILKMEA